MGHRGASRWSGSRTAPSPGRKRCRSGTLTLRTIAAAVADAGLTMDQIDGFTTGALFPSSGGRPLTDGVEIVTADWVVEQLRVQPRWLCGFQGVGQICGSLILAANAVASGAADYVVMHRAMHNPPRSLPRQPHDPGDGCGPVDRTPRLLGSTGAHGAAVHGVHAALWRETRTHGRAGGRGQGSWCSGSLVVLA